MATSANWKVKEANLMCHHHHCQQPYAVQSLVHCELLMAIGKVTGKEGDTMRFWQS